VEGSGVRGMSVTGPHLSRRRAFGATRALVLRLGPEHLGSARFSLRTIPLPSPLRSSFPAVKRSFSSIPRVSIAYMNSTSWDQRSDTVEEFFPLAVDMTYSVPSTGYSPAGNKTKREYNAVHLTSVRESPIFIFVTTAFFRST
jgi:hypothetical protein